MSDSEQTYELGFTRLVSSACRPPSWLWRLMVASFLEQILASRQARKQHNGCIPPPPQDTATVDSVPNNRTSIGRCRRAMTATMQVCTFPIVPPTRSLPLMRKSTAVALDLRQTLRHAQSRSLALQACSLRAMKLLLSCMFSVDAYLSSWMSTTMRYATGGLRLCQVLSRPAQVCCLQGPAPTLTIFISVLTGNLDTGCPSWQAVEQPCSCWFSGRMEYGKAPKVATAASFFQRLCYSNKDMLMAGMICAGWDSVKGGQVYALPIGGALLERPYATGGSGSTYIYGFCDAHYKPGMTKEQCVDFVTRAISHAMARDCSSGGVIRMVVIDVGGVERKFVSGNKLPYGPL
uniref:proteasome endopeptidase complex n=2 Tax=Chrysotila carterae TaxID=13221 RepID=A0A7S4B6S7_CHRCT